MALDSGGLTDEVWAQLDPGAGRLHRRQTLWILMAAGIVLTLTVTVAATWHKWVTPRLELVNVSMTGSGKQPPSGPSQWEYTYSLEIVNRGVDLTVVRIGRSWPGLTLVDAHVVALTEVGSVTGYNRQPWPFTVHRGEHVRVDLVYRSTGCAPRDVARYEIPVTLDRWWGAQRSSVAVDFFETWADIGGQPGCGPN